jgi:hypothetical protein
MVKAILDVFHEIAKSGSDDAKIDKFEMELLIAADSGSAAEEALGDHMEGCLTN